MCNLIYIFIIIVIIFVIKNKKQNINNRKNELLKIIKHKKKYSNLQLARYYHEKQIPNLAIQFYNKCLLNNNYYVMIDLGNIYHYGLGGMGPNYYKATLYYSNFLNIKGIDNKYKRDVSNRLKQLNEIIYNPTDNRINKLDKNEMILNLDKYLLDIIFKYDIQNNVTVVENTIIDEDIEYNNGYEDYDEYAYLDNNENIDINNGIDYNNIYYDNINDPQNVHSSTVNFTIKNSIEKLEKTTDNKYTYMQLKKKLLADITNMNIDSKKIKNINKVFEKIDNDQTASYNSNKTLKDIFELVTNNIYTSTDSIYKENAINNLLLEMCDCVDTTNNVVCFTGVYNRLIDSLHLINPDIVVKNEEILNQEILNKCSKYRIDYEKLENQDSSLKIYIMSELNNEYVKTKILKQSELDDIIKDWIDYV